MSAEADLAPQRFERCRVLQRIRSGPLTDLYRAEQLPLGRVVLIKALSENVLPSSPFAAVLEREARLLSELVHDNILRLYDFHRREESMWLVLEHIEGLTLAALLEEQTKLSPDVAAAIALQLTRALAHAHSHGVVHRDVCPENVLVGRDGRVKLMNFAVASDERLPTAPELLETNFGSPAYMSPEQVLGEAPEARSDIFCLGVVLYEMLTGKHPFDAPDSRDTTQRIRHEAPLPLSRSSGNVSPALERVVMRCLQKLPQDRFSSSAELGAALEAIVAESNESAESLVARGVSGRRPDEGDRPSKRHIVRKRRTPTVGLALRGYLMALGLIVVGAGAIQYAAARTGESDARHKNTTLELVPAKRSHLRVVADPWATVIVDGQRVDTTPFAYAIPLSAGVHYVRLEHPKAPTERRTIRLAPGETVLLDVKMDVERHVMPPTAPTPAQSTDPSTP